MRGSAVGWWHTLDGDQPWPVDVREGEKDPQVARINVDANVVDVRLNAVPPEDRNDCLRCDPLEAQIGRQRLIDLIRIEARAGPAEMAAEQLSVRAKARDHISRGSRCSRGALRARTLGRSAVPCTSLKWKPNSTYVPLGPMRPRSCSETRALSWKPCENLWKPAVALYTSSHARASKHEAMPARLLPTSAARAFVERVGKRIRTFPAGSSK